MRTGGNGDGELRTRLVSAHTEISVLQKKIVELRRVLDAAGEYFVWSCEGPYGPSPKEQSAILTMIREVLREEKR